jgi:hypothetical protein
MPFDPATLVRGRTPLPVRAIVLGPEKVGKSTFCSGAPNPIFIPISRERGVDELDVVKTPPVATWQELDDRLAWLFEGSHNFGTLVLDSSSTLEPIIWAQTCADHGVDGIEKVLGGYGKGFTEALKYWQYLMDGLDAIREQRKMHILLTGHTTTKTFDDPETESYSMYEWDIHKGARQAMARWSDAILFANFKKTMIVKEDAGFGKKIKRGAGTGARALYTEKRPVHPGGTRYALPYELPLKWDRFIGAVDMSRTSGAQKEASAAAEASAA